MDRGRGTARVQDAQSWYDTRVFVIAKRHRRLDPPKPLGYRAPMRYRIGTSPEEAGSPELLIFAGAAAFGLVIGVGFVVFGWRGRQMWLTVWGAGLVLASLAYLGYVGLAAS